ncbi:MAG: hypothetical protein IPO40_18435 [Fibrobacteres bacterium]|nr:hypothetical protein [Fibrobacterota bacterium]
MRRLGFREALSILALIAAAIPSRAAQQAPALIIAPVVDSSQFLTWTYQEAPMGLFLPKRTDHPVPVVMFLHGCNNDPVYAQHWIISALNAIEPVAVFLPTAPVTPNTPYPCADWGGTYDSKIRYQLKNALHELDSLVATHGLDANRQYIYGESMGGEGVYRLLMDFPAKFAGAVDVAGYTVNKGAAQMAKTPLWIVIGSDDDISSVDSSRAIYAAIQQAGGTLVKYTEYPDLGHVPAIEKARTDAAYLEWLLGQKLSSGVIPRPDVSKQVESKEIFTVTNGTLRFTTALPAGSRLTFSDVSGKSLFETDIRSASIQLPSALKGRVVFWRVSARAAVKSGKTTLLP